MYKSILKLMLPVIGLTADSPSNQSKSTDNRAWRIHEKYVRIPRFWLFGRK